MSDISSIPVSQLRAAAAAWRAHYLQKRFGWFGPIIVSANASTFDRIDEMIDEIERLRATPKKQEGAET